MGPLAVLVPWGLVVADDRGVMASRPDMRTYPLLGCRHDGMGRIFLKYIAALRECAAAGEGKFFPFSFW
jgi:hypothetical protein